MDERGLPGTVRAEQRDHLAGPHVEIEFAHDRNAATASPMSSGVFRGPGFDSAAGARELPRSTPAPTQPASAEAPLSSSPRAFPETRVEVVVGSSPSSAAALAARTSTQDPSDGVVAPDDGGEDVSGSSMSSPSRRLQSLVVFSSQL